MYLEMYLGMSMMTIFVVIIKSYPFIISIRSKYFIVVICGLFVVDLIGSHSKSCII